MMWKDLNDISHLSSETIKRTKNVCRSKEMEGFETAVFPTVDGHVLIQIYGNDSDTEYIVNENGNLI